MKQEIYLGFYQETEERINCTLVLYIRVHADFMLKYIHKCRPQQAQQEIIFYAKPYSKTLDHCQKLANLIQL